MKSNQIQYFQENTRLNILEYCIIILVLLLTIIILFFPINYTKFSCTRNSNNNVVCKKKKELFMA